MGEVFIIHRPGHFQPGSQPLEQQAGIIVAIRTLKFAVGRHVDVRQMKYIGHFVDIGLRKSAGRNGMFEECSIHHLFLHIGKVTANGRCRIPLPADYHHQLAIRGLLQGDGSGNGREIRSDRDRLLILHAPYQIAAPVILHQVELVKRVRTGDFPGPGLRRRQQACAERSALSILSGTRIGGH